MENVRESHWFLWEFLESFNEGIQLMPSQFIVPFYDTLNNKTEPDL